MVIAHHLIWTNYGTWLPNDPRGGGSQQIATPRLAELGELHHGRKKIQPAGRILNEFRAFAEPELKFNVIRFDANRIESVASGLADGILQHGYTCYACAVMPDHIHLLIRKHKHQAEEMIAYLQESSRLRLCEEYLNLLHHPIWTTGGRKIFSRTPDDVRCVIRYIVDNPPQIGLPRQTWSFVTPYDGWPFHKRRKAKSRGAPLAA
jgi:REP element-mobilizing transposase RayT